MTTTNISDLVKVQLKKQILDVFPERTNVELGDTAISYKNFTHRKLKITGRLFSETGSGRDFTAVFKKNEEQWVIYDYSYDY